MSKEGKDKVLPEENSLSEKTNDETPKEETATEKKVVSNSDESLKVENIEPDAESIDGPEVKVEQSSNIPEPDEEPVDVQDSPDKEVKTSKDSRGTPVNPEEDIVENKKDEGPEPEKVQTEEGDSGGDKDDNSEEKIAKGEVKAKAKAKTKAKTKVKAKTKEKVAEKVEDKDMVEAREESKSKVKADPDAKVDEEKEKVSADVKSDGIKDPGVVDKSNEEAVKEDVLEERKEDKDYSSFTKEQIVDEFIEILKNEDTKVVERLVKLIRPFYEKLFESEKADALEKYIKDGGEKDGFEYTKDVHDNRYEAAYDKFRSRRGAYYADLEQQKDINLGKKHECLEKLRHLIESEETTASIGDLKKLQQEWKSIGPVPNQHVKSLWASYNILIDRFYDNRSIYFELKELDRKKNLNAKFELCQKAEALIEYDNIGDAIKELNELHEEFKHIGPVPKEQQEEIWIRFKAASDAIYSRRKEFMVDLKKELHTNYEDKKKLVEEIQTFRDFDSEKISDWNEKTKELLDIQKRWEKIGGLPREHAKEINKGFWSGFKEFFNNKNKFFKKLESKRDENLKLKQELVERAQELKASEDWENTANKLKEIQTAWKDIGPVPEKMRNEVFKQFKDACDEFFNRRRERLKHVDDEYQVNLEKKEKICGEIEAMNESGELDLEKFQTLQTQYLQLGFVPRNAIKKIQKRYTNLVEKFLADVDLSEDKKNELRFSAEVNRLKSSPNSEKRIQRKENDIRRQISKIENDLAIWKNNLEFFASSKTADKVREEFDKKINNASKLLDELKDELKVLNKI